MEIVILLALFIGQLYVPATQPPERCRVEERRPCGGIIRH